MLSRPLGVSLYLKRRWASSLLCIYLFSSTAIYLPIYMWSIFVQGFQEKRIFFIFHFNASFAYIAVWPLKFPAQWWVHSHSYWLVIFVQPIAAECWRRIGGKLSRILWEKNNILWTPCTLILIFYSFIQNYFIELKIKIHPNLFILNCADHICLLKTKINLYHIKG